MSFVDRYTSYEENLLKKLKLVVKLEILDGFTPIFLIIEDFKRAHLFIPSRKFLTDQGNHRKVAWFDNKKRS